MNQTNLNTNPYYFNRESDIPLFLKQFSRLYNSTSVNFPKLDKSYSLKDQYSKRNEINSLIKFFEKAVNDSSLLKSQTKQIELFNNLKHFFQNTLEYEKNEVEILFSDTFKKLVNDFISKAKNFDNSLSANDLFQAIRNVWIMNTIQLIFSKKVELTPSIFAYSLLYPYSDNYLDDNSVNVESKISFLGRFGQRLSGIDVLPENKNESKIFELIEMIEAEFPRDIYHAVYESLLAIHYSQVKSISQQKGDHLLQKNILEISIEKGGSSVLADAYLVMGNLTIEEAEFMFGFGFFLQLIDDLQDISEDSENNHTTTFTNCRDKKLIALKINRLINFIDSFIKYTPLQNRSSIILKIIRYSCRLLIIDSAAQNKSLLPFIYRRKINRHSLYPLRYYKLLHKKINCLILLTCRLQKM